MSEADLGSAPADAAPVVAPIANVDTTVAKTPNSAVDRAMARLEKGETVDDGTAPTRKEPTADKPAADKAAKPDKADEKAAPPSDNRNADGTFKAKATDTATQPAAKTAPTTEPSKDAPKAQTPASDAPARFASDPEAKAAWATTPEPVKAAVQRTIREMEQGIEQHRGDAQAYRDTYKPFDEMAKRSNLDPAKTMANYVSIDMLLTKDFNAGIAQIFKNKGQDVKAWAAQIASGQDAPQPSAQEQTIAELRNEIAQLKQGFDGVSQTMQRQRDGQISQSLEGYIATLEDADKALFNELDAEIAANLQADPSTTLAAAFAKAKKDDSDRYARRYGAQTSVATVPADNAAAQTRDPDPAPQTRKGDFSIHGAPGSGSDPAPRKGPNATPRKSPDDAIERAMRSMGLA